MLNSLHFVYAHDFPVQLRHLRTSVRILQAREVGPRQTVVAVINAFADPENALKVARRSWTDYYFICGYCTNSVLETFTMALRCCISHQYLFRILTVVLTLKLIL